jgi:hypothetical protein
LEKCVFVRARAELLEPITLHECGHAFASLKVRAGVSATAASTCMRHVMLTLALERHGRTGTS